MKEYEESSQPKDNKTFYYVVRGTIYDTFKFDVFMTAFFAFMGEISAIAYSMFLKVLVDYLKDDKAPVYMGVIYVLIFGLLMLCSSICRNQYFFRGCVVALNIRKTLISALYTKISKLSMKSLTETNSGKLITIVSGDIQAIERALGAAPIILAAPFVNIIAYLILGFSAGWEYAGITFAIWIIIMISQHLASEKAKSLKLKESKINDER